MSESARPSSLTEAGRQQLDEAILEISEGRYGAAEEKLRLLAQEAPEETLIWSKLGVVCAQTQRLEEAKNCFYQALELQPEHAASLTNLGNVFFLEGDVKTAESLHRRALEIEPQYVTARQNLAALLKNQARYQELIRLQRRAGAPGSAKTQGCLPVLFLTLSFVLIAARVGSVNL